MRANILLTTVMLFVVILSATAADDNIPPEKQPAAIVQHQLLTDILNDYVHNGRVDYDNMRKDERLDQYLTQVVNTDPNTLSNRNERFAFWINAYNAYTLKVICENYPIESINDLSFGGLYLGSLLGKTVWDNDFAEVNHKKYTLNEIEHKVVRPRFKDARAHFALVCASRSCPPLRPEAYEGYKLDGQLDNQGMTFFAQTTKNYFDLNDKKAKLSPILDWFSEDFGDSDEKALLYVTRFLPEHLAKAIQRDIKDWKVEYFSFNWELND